MKRIELKTEKPIDSVSLFREVLGNSPPGRPFNLDEMRKRVRVLNAIEALASNATHIDLEDADHEALKTALETTPYNIATAQVLAIIDAGLNAKEPPTAKTE